MDKIQLLISIGILVPSLFVDYLSATIWAYKVGKMSEAISERDVPPAKRAKLETVKTNDRDKEKEAEIEIGRKHADLSDDTKYINFVTPEELEKLKEFKVLDEVKSNDEDSNDESESSDGKSEVPEDEIEKMLEEDLPDDFKGAPQPKKKPYVTRQKIVLEEKGVNHWEVLPLDWMVVRHYSGMPVYMHRTTRVCTLSKPYFLGKGNTRRHDIPISAIPCLAYRRALEEERKQQEIDRKIAEQIKNGTWVNNTTNQKSENAENSVAVNSNGTSENHVETEATLDNVKEKDEMNTGKTKDVTILEKLATTDKIAISNDSTEDTITENVQDDKLKIEDTIISDKSGDVTEDTKATPKCPFLNRNKVENTEGKLEGVCPVTGKSRDDVVMEVPATDKYEESDKSIGDNVSKFSITEMNADVFEMKVAIDKDEANKSIEEGTVAEGCVSEFAKDDDVEKPSDDVDKPSDDTEIPKHRQPVVLPGGIVMPAPKVETINNSWKTQHLSHERVNDYCKKLFKFKTVNIMHFNRWADRRKYNKARKTLQYPTLPDGTKLITIPARPNGQDNGGKPAKRDWVMNMDGRSYLSVFHEYVRRALQKQPVYEFVQLENAATPYQATVYIGGMQYGVGHGSSKRQAKSAAARASIHILIPEMKDELDAPANSEPDFTFFDYVGIEDPRISEFCAATCEPSPHAILRTCLLRNFGASDRHIHTEMKKLEFQKIELTMKVGKHTATVVCKNKKTAKQRASQAILQALHPHVRSWGSLLRLYGSRSVKSFKEKKLEEQQITLLQDRARHNQPNKAVLDKLRRDMIRLRERDAACVPKGTLLLEDDLPTHSGSNLNNVDL